MLVTRRKIASEESDCTASYTVTVNPGTTVKDFIRTILKEYPNEWGYIGIDSGRPECRYVFGDPKCEYSHGKIISDIGTDGTIKSVSATGGWSRMDYLLTL